DRETVPEVPDPDHTDLVAAGEQPAIRADRQDLNVPLVAVQWCDLTCRSLPEDTPGEVPWVILAGVLDLIVQEILGTFELPIFERLAGQAELGGVKMPVG